MELEQAARLARTLMDAHGLRRWEFAWDRAKVRAGACHHGDRRITLSRHLTQLHDEGMVRETVLHEVAHALVGPRHGHDAVWRRKARAIGASGDRCWSGDEDTTVPGRWEGRCAAGHVVQRHRRPVRLLVCRRCVGVADRERLLRWTCDGVPVPLESLGPDVRTALAAVEGRAASGERVRVLPPGTRVSVLGGGRWAGRTGTVVRRGRTRYVVRLGTGEQLHVPFELAREDTGS